MGKAARQKEKRQSTAAYAASQPLFDALRIGMTKVNEQRSHLSIARDIVQNLHVKIYDAPSEPSKGGVSNHERYVDCAVKAWRSATQVYAEIFDALAKVTAADATEGREARYGHAEFSEMARTAEAAKGAARAWTLYEELRRAREEAAGGRVGEDLDDEMEDASGSEGDDDSEDEIEDKSDSDASSVSDTREDSQAKSNAEPIDSTPTNPILLQLLGKRPAAEPDIENQGQRKQQQMQEPAKKVERLSEKIKYDEKGRKIFWDKGAEKPNVPYATLGSREKKAWKAEKARQKREKKREQRAAKTMAEVKAAEAKTGQSRGSRVGTKMKGFKFEPDRRAPPGFVEDVNKPVHDRDFLSLDAEAGTAELKTNGALYEDVSAEVEARMKAKEERKKAKKEEKKRKRESAESVPNGEVVEDKAEKPKKKKAKSLEGGVVEDAATKEVARKHEREVENEGVGEAKKKRKKSQE